LKKGITTNLSRAIASRLSEGMPEADRYSKLADYSRDIQAMPLLEQYTLAAAYNYSRQVPEEDRRDVFQDLVAYILERLDKIDEARNPKAYLNRIAHNWWCNWLRRKKQRAKVQTVELEEVEYSLADTRDIIAEVEANLQSASIWQVLPSQIQAIIRKRLNGVNLTASERSRLWFYRQDYGDSIRELAGLPASYGQHPNMRRELTTSPLTDEQRQQRPQRRDYHKDYLKRKGSTKAYYDSISKKAKAEGITIREYRHRKREAVK